MTPQNLYQRDLDSGEIVADPAQADVVQALDSLYQHWQAQTAPGGSWVGRLLQRFVDADKAVQGLYLWGGVGRGKTYLMDLLVEALPENEVIRTHFHRFMQDVHGRLTAMQGQADPLKSIANDYAEQASVLCFDEFFVLDIGDAMILAGLLEALFERGVVLVATSNIHPEGLYENGLQRDRFLPAIALIQRHCRVLELGSPTDYRLRSLTQAPLFFTPANAETLGKLEQRFCELTREQARDSAATLEILGRELQARRLAADTVWFEFSELCGTARSAFDYVELARLFHTVILDGIPRLDDDRNHEAKRFISLIDALYDRRVKLIASSAVPIDQVYVGTALAFPFERSRSRLIEMQSTDYLAASHEA